jgi:putative sterol carrier protein
LGEPTTDFFEQLSSRGHEPMLETTSGTIRVDLVKNGKPTERWLVSIDKGDIDVSHKSGKPDCVVRGPEALFDRISSGEENAFAAALRGEVIIEGDSKLLVRFQGLFPSPPRARARKGRKR